MIAKLACSPDAARQLCKVVGMMGTSGAAAAEIEFRELPYFLVSRSRETWTEGRGDINAVRLLQVNDFGLIVDPGTGQAGEATDQAAKHTVIPWSNVVSLTVERSE